MRDVGARGHDGARVRHVDAHDAVDPAGADGRDERRVAPDLLRHREDLDAEPIRLGAQRAGVRLHGVEVEHVAATRNRSRLVERDRRLEERRVPAAEQIEEHQVKTTRGMHMPTFHMPMSTIS